MTISVKIVIVQCSIVICHSILLESKSRHQKTLPRQEIRGGAKGCYSRRDHLSKTSVRVAVRKVAGRCPVWIGWTAIKTGVHKILSGGVIPIRAVEYVAEFHPHIQTHAFLDPELAPKIHILHGAALRPVVAVIRGGTAELALGGILPRIGIQHECLVWIVTVAVNINRVQRHARLAVRETGPLEQQRIETRLSIWNLKRKTAGVLDERSPGPVG